MSGVVVQPKTKTKAKTRYLKRKKERRKQRTKGQGGQQRANGNEQGDVDTEDGEVEADGEEVEEEETVMEVIQARETSPRPAKKRKVEADSDSSSTDDEQRAPEQRSRDPTPAPDVALHSFPLPVAPKAPSKATLALQGLDKALLNAELIDPTRTLPLDALERPSGQLPVLSEKMKKRLVDLGVSELFAVQTALLPFLLPPQKRYRALYMPYYPPRDVCASAPTGSGKTLAYVVPIIEILSARIATRLRALVVLPTRDLVMQVQETFEAVSKGRGLKIGVATGQHSFAHEQSQLVSDQTTELHGGSSKVDILICTPGRLIDHLNGTPNFSLQHLRFLVVDEADRLLAQSFQDWLSQVLAAIRAPPTKLVTDSMSSLSLTPHHDALAPSWMPSVATDFDDKQEPSCQKLLFSATLTRDPSKIVALGLRDPKYFIVQGGENDEVHVTEKFTMPPTLKEHMLVCSTAQKPLMLFHLMHVHNVSNALVFTKSAESTTRLVRLYEFFKTSLCSAENAKGMTLQAYSSDVSASERRTILEKFKTKEIDILVCSDLISRGIDISHVSHVISYDTPVDMRKYVHRVGRTARAGRDGDAWTLVEDQEARHFKIMMREASHLDKLAKMKVGDSDLEPLLPHYETALRKLKELYGRS